MKVIASLREAVGEVVSSMISAFLEDTPIYIGKLEVPLKENNVRQVRDMAHTIKGSAANFGATESGGGEQTVGGCCVSGGSQ